MKLGALLLLLFFATSAAVCASQKAEPNPQVPATPPANSPGAMGSSHAPGIPMADDAALQGRIQQALQNDSGLAASHITVAVTNSDIQLSGTVASGKDRETVDRIAQSFDGNRRFTDKLVVSGQAQPQPPAKTGTANPKR